MPGVSLVVRRGEITCVLGDNGAVRSTLVTIVAGFHRRSESHRVVRGEPLGPSSPREALARIGVDLPDLDHLVGGRSGGQCPSVAIARAVRSGAEVLVLDEPTAALRVKHPGIVLRRVPAARDAGLGVVLITHDPHHASSSATTSSSWTAAGSASMPPAGDDPGSPHARDGGGLRARGAGPRAGP